MLRRLFFASIAFLLTAFLLGTSYAGRQILEDEMVIVSFDTPLQKAAWEVFKVYPAIRTELSRDSGWRTDFRPQVVLIKDSASFRKVANSDLVIAQAIPPEDLIIIDYARMNVHPFTLGTTLKHELLRTSIMDIDLTVKF